jgi:hypothetical protein
MSHPANSKRRGSSAIVGILEEGVAAGRICCFLAVNASRYLGAPRPNRAAPPMESVESSASSSAPRWWDTAVHVHLLACQAQEALGDLQLRRDLGPGEGRGRQPQLRQI